MPYSFDPKTMTVKALDIPSFYYALQQGACNVVLLNEKGISRVQ